MMRINWWIHVLFWLAYWGFQGFLTGRYDMNFGRAYLAEFAHMPIKVAATYLVIWVVRRRTRLAPLQLVGLIGLIILAGLLINRSISYVYIFGYLYADKFPEVKFFDLFRWFISLIDIASVVFFVSTVRLGLDFVANRQREQALMQEKLRSELQFLRAQTNPHFLFNTLNNIYALARKNAPQTPEVLLKLSHLLRFMLYECSEPFIPLSSELTIIQQYIALEQLRYNERLRVSYHEDVDEPGQLLAPLLILPLVENAFKHGAGESRFEADIRIEVRLREGLLDVHLFNTKDSSPNHGGSGIGLSNVRRQLELIYPDSHQLSIQESPDSYDLHLRIELGGAVTQGFMANFQATNTRPRP